MLKLISIKDPHLSLGFLNRIRIDYKRDILAKLSFIRNHIQDNGIKAIILTGDITDSNYERKWSFKQYVQNKRAFESLKPTRDIDILSPVGNHDMFHGLEDSQDTVFDELVRENVIKNITNYTQVYEPVNTTSNKRVKVYGIDFSNNKETILNHLSRINSDTFIGLDYYKIVVLHNNLTPGEDRLSEFLYQELADKFPNINMVIAGHYHLGFPTQKVGNTIFINNWNLTRVVRDYDVTLDKHTPEFEEIIFDDDLNFVSTKTIKIPFKTFDEAFVPNAVNIIKKSKKEIFEFFNIDFDDIITKQTDEEILDQFEYPPEIVQLALDYLNRD
jgi:DNA repair exonuclease SbcCD nuclease subunit